MMPPTLCAEDEAVKEAWTGVKRRKAGGCSSPIDLASPPSFDATEKIQEEQGECQEEGIGFSSSDDISYEEVRHYRKELRSRRYLNVDHSRKIPLEHRDDVYNRLCNLRQIEFKLLEKDPGTILDDSYPVWAFEDASEAGPSMFGWTIDSDYFYLSELNDYQRIVPTRASLDEYRDWENYRTTFSKYETDVDYVKYCDEISKKIKWVERYVTAEYGKDLIYENRGARQAIKIAVGFSNLRLDLALRGYEEYIWDLRYDLELRDYIHSYFEVWKLIAKQELSFEDALKQALSENTFNYPSLIEHQIRGRGLISLDFKRCLEVIPTCATGDEVLKLITKVVYSKVCSLINQ